MTQWITELALCANVTTYIRLPDKRDHSEFVHAMLSWSLGVPESSRMSLRSESTQASCPIPRHCIYDISWRMACHKVKFKKSYRLIYSEPGSRVICISLIFRVSFIHNITISRDWYLIQISFIDIQLTGVAYCIQARTDLLFQPVMDVQGCVTLFEIFHWWCGRLLHSYASSWKTNKSPTMASTVFVGNLHLRNAMLFHKTQLPDLPS